MINRTILFAFCVAAMVYISFSCTTTSRSYLHPYPSLGKLNKTEIDVKIKSDILAIRRYRNGIKRIHGFLNARRDIFQRPKKTRKRVFNKDEREIIVTTWRSFLDYFLALESLRQYHSKFLTIKDINLRYASFRCYYSSFVSQYRYALEFLQITEKDTEFQNLLNEPLPQLGIYDDSYARFRYKYLNIITATKFTALNLMYKAYRHEGCPKLDREARNDIKRIWKFGRGRGIVLTVKNAFRIVKDSASRIFFPVQSGVAEWMGDTKVRRLKRNLISLEQLNEMLPEMEPGDIFLERREWYLSNIGLPGFWPHAALFIGTPDERQKYFTGEELTDWVKRQGEPSGDFEMLLVRKFPRAYALHQKLQEERRPSRVIEAVSEGVVFTTFEHSAQCDSLAVMRPKLSKIEKARAIMIAFGYSGRPYDFNFDFRTDRTVVCTELVFKAYEPVLGYTGIPFKLKKLLGRQVLSANDIVRQYDEKCKNGEPHMNLIAFLDGYENKHRAVKESKSEFRKSWERPKWHVFVKRELPVSPDDEG